MMSKDCITFIDIDMTVFYTFAKILVRNKDTGEITKELDNQEFNSYRLKSYEEYDFNQFRDSKFFYETSKPIEKNIKRVQKMIDDIERNNGSSRIVFLTAREDFDNKENVIKTFEKNGIKIKKPITYIERSGNIKVGTIEEKKERIISNYLKTKKYKIVRLLDDHKPNLIKFLELKRKKFQDLKFFALESKNDGSLERVYLK